MSDDPTYAPVKPPEHSVIAQQLAANTIVSAMSLADQYNKLDLSDPRPKRTDHPLIQDMKACIIKRNSLGPEESKVWAALSAVIKEYQRAIVGFITGTSADTTRLMIAIHHTNALKDVKLTMMREKSVSAGKNSDGLTTADLMKVKEQLEASEARDG
jgi:hypothetical protein